jgi:hypothetical protein
LSPGGRFLRQDGLLFVAYRLFRPSFARRSGLREGGKPVSIPDHIEDMDARAKAVGRRRLTAIKEVIDWVGRRNHGGRLSRALKPEKRLGLPLARRASYKAPQFHALRLTGASFAGTQ